MTPKQKVLKEWPSAYFDAGSRSIQRYTEGLSPLGVGSVLARSIEASAWKDAARNIRTRDETTKGD